MEEKTQTMAVPAWFYVVAVLALLWEAIGCYMYVTQVSADPATLPIDQRAMWEASPPWMIAAYAFGVWIGLFGAALLLLRRKAAETMLLVSFLAVVVQFSALLLVPAADHHRYLLCHLDLQPAIAAARLAALGASC